FSQGGFFGDKLVVVIDTQVFDDALKNSLKSSFLLTILSQLQILHNSKRFIRKLCFSVGVS
ncbi:MAG TPA: hypothetical protein DDZ36_00885, partial [Deltaproteobacteria bacterium]|nr:hypothetical protein [Deltaproteobacteria bacterium]